MPEVEKYMYQFICINYLVYTHEDVLNCQMSREVILTMLTVVSSRESSRFFFSSFFVLSHVWLFVTSWTVARQVPLSLGLSGQEG